MNINFLFLMFLSIIISKTVSSEYKVKVNNPPGYDGSCTEDDIYHIGKYYTYNWRTGDFEGTGVRKWTNDAKQFEFNWNTINGNQIGRIGKNIDSDPAGAVQLKDLPENYLMSCTFEIQNYSTSDGGWSIWSVYGWTHRKNVSWPKKLNKEDDGWDYEFYIVFVTDLPALKELTAGYIDKGSTTIDGVVYKIYKNNMSWGSDNQTQWMAVADSPQQGKVTIDVKKILEYWIDIDDVNSIPENDYLVDLTFAVEAAGKSEGRLILSEIVIP